MEITITLVWVRNDGKSVYTDHGVLECYSGHHGLTVKGVHNFLTFSSSAGFRRVSGQPCQRTRIAWSFGTGINYIVFA